MTRGWLITRGADSGGADGKASATIDLAELDDEALAPTDGAAADVEVAVTWSSLNYKDALAFAGNPGVARLSPLVPGIDVVGHVAVSHSSRWAVGDRVLLNGAGAGETRHGGLAERAVLDGETLVASPSVFTDAHVAGIGTAGFTAMLAVLALERHGIKPGRDADVLVTGASGGLGSFAVALLSRAGFTVTAVTGQPKNAARLRQLGATTIVERSTFDRDSRALESQRWMGVVDSVGGPILAAAVAQLRHGGAAIACGNAASPDLSTTVMPFILRGVALLGVNSTLTPLALREQAWARLARDLGPATVDTIAQPIELADAKTSAARLLDGDVRGRLSVRVAPDPSAPSRD
jgi:acrylyl-CoA reductase (NADPH)